MDSFKAGMEHVMRSSAVRGNLSSDDFPPLAKDQAAPQPSKSATGSSSEPAASSSSDQSLSWRSLLGSSTKLQYFEPVVENGKKMVYISKETHGLGFALLEKCLVGQFFGPLHKVAKILGTVANLWGR